MQGGSSRRLPGDDVRRFTMSNSSRSRRRAQSATRADNASSPGEIGVRARRIPFSFLAKRGGWSARRRTLKVSIRARSGMAAREGNRCLGARSTLSRAAPSGAPAVRFERALTRRPRPGRKPDRGNRLRLRPLDASRWRPSASRMYVHIVQFKTLSSGGGRPPPMPGVPVKPA